MREIKFRVWDKDDREMIYGIDECLMNWDNLKRRVDRFLNMPSHIPVMQYTGLKDRDSKEIWEGDIIEYELTGYPKDKCKGKVFWDDERAGFDPFVDYDDDCNIHVDMETVKKIGNIYENPELLK